MTKTVTRLFDSHTEALASVEALEAAGIDHDKISIVSNNADNWHDGHRHASGADVSQIDGDDDNDAAEGAGKGATAGGLLGGGAGLLAGLGMLAIPGLGPVVAAGWLVSTAVGAAIGAAAGGATGGLLGALKDAGHSEDEANVFSEGVRRGGTLISVKAHDDEALKVEETLDTRRGVNADVRGEAYRRAGWSRFDESATPYSPDQIAHERGLYQGEQRSFTGAGHDDDRAQPTAEAPPRPDAISGAPRTF